MLTKRVMARKIRRAKWEATIVAIRNYLILVNVFLVVLWIIGPH